MRKRMSRCQETFSITQGPSLHNNGKRNSRAGAAKAATCTKPEAPSGKMKFHNAGEVAERLKAAVC